jgi:hypothetical protein
MTVDPLPLRGRQDELAVIEDRLREVSAGIGGAIVIDGSAGAGKTKLVDASMQLAHNLGFRVGLGALEPYKAGPTERSNTVIEEVGSRQARKSGRKGRKGPSGLV